MNLRNGRVTKKLSEFNWEILPHPPYSPDIAPSDYHLFRALQHKKLYNERGITFFHETEGYVNNLNIYNRSKNGTNLWDDLIDDVKHTLLHCPRWIPPLTTKSIIGEVVRKDDNWTKFQAFCKRIMTARHKQKMDVERRRRIRANSYSNW